MRVLTDHEVAEVRRKREKAGAIAKAHALKKGGSPKKKSLRERWATEARLYQNLLEEKKERKKSI